MDDYKDYLDENYDEYDDADNEEAVYSGSSGRWSRNYSDEPEKPKGFSVLQRTVLISAVIVGAAILITIICRLFFFGSFERDWHLTETVGTQDQAQVYDYNLKFDEGKVTVELGSLETRGEYTLTHVDEDLSKRILDGEDKIGDPVVIIENTFTGFDGIFSYNVSGSVFSGRKLSLTNVNNDKNTFEFDTDTVDPSAPFRNGEFSKDEKVVGTWELKDEQGSITYEFTADGNYTRTDKLPNNTQKQTGIYTCKDNVITLTYKVGKNIDVPKHYEFKNDKLIINEPVPVNELQTTEVACEYTKIK